MESVLGAVLGLLHRIYLSTIYIFTDSMPLTTRGRAIAFWYGLWAFALWTLPGSLRSRFVDSRIGRLFE